MDRLLQQKLILESEIRALEKQKRDLSFSLESLDSTHKQAFEQNQTIIKDLEKRKTTLLAQIDELREGSSKLSEAYASVKADLASFKEEQLKDVTEQLKFARENAITITQEAAQKKQEAEDLLDHARAYEWELKLKKEALDHQALELARLSESLALRLKQDTLRRQSAENHYTALSIEIDKLNASLAHLKDEELFLERKIKADSQEHEKLNILMKEKHVESLRLEESLKNRAEVIEQREQELEEEKKRLNDQRKTLERAIAEFRGKGVTI